MPYNAQVSLNLENQNLDRWSLRSMLKFIMQLVHVYLNWFRRNSLLKCLAARDRKKNPQKPLY